MDIDTLRATIGDKAIVDIVKAAWKADGFIVTIDIEG